MGGGDIFVIGKVYCVLFCREWWSSRGGGLGIGDLRGGW